MGLLRIYNETSFCIPSSSAAPVLSPGFPQRHTTAERSLDARAHFRTILGGTIAAFNSLQESSTDDFHQLFVVAATTVQKHALLRTVG